MVFTDSHIFIHCPKTGGTFLRSVLVTECGGKDSGGGHDPAFFLESQAGMASVGARRLVGVVRRPCDFYVSLYTHARRNGTGYDAQLGLWGNGSVEFRDVLYGWTHPDEVWEMPLSLGVVFGAAGHKDVDIIESGVGFASWAARYFYGRLGAAKGPCEPEWLADTLVPTDRLYDACEPLLGVPVTEESHPRVNTRASMGAVNLTARGPLDPQDWFTDDEMVEWVSKADAELIALMGWPAPFEPARNPYVHLGAN